MLISMCNCPDREIGLFTEIKLRFNEFSELSSAVKFLPITDNSKVKVLTDFASNISINSLPL